MPLPIAIVGSGLAGLVAAQHLTDAGHDVVVFERAAVVGGRLATERNGQATIDHGAQFFTVRSDDFAGFVTGLVDEGVVYQWCLGFNEVDGYPRYAVHGGMDQLAAALASTLGDVRLGTAIDAVSAGQRGYRLHWAGGELDASAVLLNAPAPESLALLDRGRTVLDPAVDAGLRALEYHRVLAVLATLDRPSAVPEPGARQLDEGAFSFVSDNQRKGISEAPAVTLHASHAVSANRWDDDSRAVLVDLLAEARPWLGDAAVLEAELVRWPYAGPVRPWPDRACLAATAPGPLVMAGDAFGGPKVEGAYLSGLAAAALLAGGS